MLRRVAIDYRGVGLPAELIGACWPMPTHRVYRIGALTSTDGPINNARLIKPGVSRLSVTRSCRIRIIGR